MAFTTVEGEITRVFHEGKGARLKETFTKRDGLEGSKEWTLWFKDPHGLVEGDRGTFRGSHSDEVDEWQGREGDTRHSVKRALNGTTPVGDRTVTDEAQGAQKADQGEPWAMNAPDASTDVWATAPLGQDDNPWPATESTPF